LRTADIGEVIDAVSHVYCADLAVAPMSLLAQNDALIIDLRRNGGGDGATGNRLTGYLLDGPQEK